MKKISAILFSVCLFGVCEAQTFDDIMLKKRYVNCMDVSFNAPEMIRSLREKNELDSLYSFLNYWESKCGYNESIESIRVLLDIKTANFDSTAITDALFSTLLSYKRFYWRENYDLGSPEYAQLHKTLQEEKHKIASDIQATYSTDESLIQDFYITAPVNFNKIKQASSKESKLKRLYDKEVQEALRIPEFHAALFLGYYHPFGKLDVFGPHASIGGILGARQLRHNYDLVLDVRFGRSKDDYSFIYNGNLVTDDKWTSFYMGFEYTYDFIASKKFRLGASPGVAYNGITAVPADEKKDQDAKFLPGLDLNGGLAAKYAFGKNGCYAGLQARYHWVDHRNQGGTELNGNYLSIRLIFGSIFNYDRENRLRVLEN